MKITATSPRHARPSLGLLVGRWLRVLLAAAACLAPSAHAQLEEGRDFRTLEPAQPVSSGARIEVIEFFYYGCPVCYEAQPHVSRWLLRAGPGVSLVRVPAVFTDSSVSFARSFYALEAMGEVGRLHWPLYDNHHFDGRKLNEDANIISWAAHNGVDGERFRTLRMAPETTEKVERARRMLETHGVRGVPSFVIDGKYVTSAGMAGGVPQLIRVLEFLVTRAGTERPR